MDIWYKLFLFVAGFILDVLGTLDTLAVQKQKPSNSAFYSFTLTMLGYTVFYDIIITGDVYLNIAIYALGGALGGYVTILWDKNHGS